MVQLCSLTKATEEITFRVPTQWQERYQPSDRIPLLRVHLQGHLILNHYEHKVTLLKLHLLLHYYGEISFKYTHTHTHAHLKPSSAATQRTMHFSRQTNAENESPWWALMTPLPQQCLYEEPCLSASMLKTNPLFLLHRVAPGRAPLIKQLFGNLPPLPLPASLICRDIQTLYYSFIGSYWERSLWKTF